MRYGILLISLVFGNCAAQQLKLGMSAAYSPKNKTWHTLGYGEFYHPLRQKDQLQLGVYTRFGSTLNTLPALFAEAGFKLHMAEPISGIPGRLQISAGFAEWCEKKKIPQAELQQGFLQSWSFTSMVNFRISYDIPITRNISIGPYFELWGKITGNGMAGNSVCCAPVVGLSITISLNRSKKKKAFYPIKNWMNENPAAPGYIPNPKPVAGILANETAAFWKH